MVVNQVRLVVLVATVLMVQSVSVSLASERAPFTGDPGAFAARAGRTDDRQPSGGVTSVRQRAGTLIAPVSATVSRGLYGPGIAADTLANTQLGGTDCGCGNSMTSYRFRAVTSAGLASIRIYVQGGSGYSGGNGGTIQISVQSDDGTSSHRPSGKVLAKTTLQTGNPVATGPLPKVSFATPARLVSGRLYHLVFRNIDAEPRQNFVSLNGLLTHTATSPRQPAMRDTDWAQLLTTGRGWKTRPHYTPIAGLGYTNGVEDGVGYMEVWEDSSNEISGERQVREAFSLRTARSIESVTIRVRRLGGSGPLEARIETREGALVTTGSIAAGSVGSDWAWERITFPAPVVLPVASSYRIVFSAPADSQYTTVLIRKGVAYRFGRGTYFPYGYAQYTTGSDWLDFGGGRQADLQFYFR